MSINDDYMATTGSVRPVGLLGGDDGVHIGKIWYTLFNLEAAPMTLITCWPGQQFNLINFNDFQTVCLFGVVILGFDYFSFVLADFLSTLVGKIAFSSLYFIVIYF